MLAEKPLPSGAVRPVSGRPCKRCGGSRWQAEVRPKSKLRWWLEMAFAAPDVLIFQSESGGWPSAEYERWTCLACGRHVRVGKARS